MAEGALQPAPLSQRVATGIKWSLASQGGRQVVRIVTLIALTRLISPRDFGLMSMALVVVAFLELLRDMGTSDALIQTRRLTARLFSTMFWANVAFGLIAEGCCSRSHLSSRTSTGVQASRLWSS